MINKINILYSIFISNRGHIMDRLVEFKNFKHTQKDISADLYVDGNFLMRVLGNLDCLYNDKETDVLLYEYFRSASLYYMNQSTVPINQKYLLNQHTN